MKTEHEILAAQHGVTDPSTADIRDLERAARDGVPTAIAEIVSRLNELVRAVDERVAGCTREGIDNAGLRDVADALSRARRGQ